MKLTRRDFYPVGYISRYDYFSRKFARYDLNRFAPIFELFPLIAAELIIEFVKSMEIEELIPIKNLVKENFYKSPIRFQMRLGNRYLCNVTDKGDFLAEWEKEEDYDEEEYFNL